MKRIADKIKEAAAVALNSFDFKVGDMSFDEAQKRIGSDAVRDRYRNDPVFHAKVCSLEASILGAVSEEIESLRTRVAEIEAMMAKGEPVAIADSLTSNSVRLLRPIPFGSNLYLHPAPTPEDVRMPDATISAYELPDGSRLERVAQIDGSYKWAVRHCGNCLGSDGEWQPEYSPSNRTEEFIRICRFDSVEYAYKAWDADMREGEKE